MGGTAPALVACCWTSLCLTRIAQSSYPQNAHLKLMGRIDGPVDGNRFDLPFSPLAAQPFTLKNQSKKTDQRNAFFQPAEAVLAIALKTEKQSTAQRNV